MSMTISTGDDSDELDRDDDNLDIDRDDDQDDDRPTRRSPADDTDDDAEDDDEGKSEEELRAELKRVRASAKTYSKQGARRRDALKEARQRIRELEGKVDTDPDDDADPDDEETPAQKKPSNLDARAIQRRIDKARKETRRELEEAHTRDLIDTRAESALTRAGVSDKNIRLLKRELDYDELELLKDRTVDGLEDEIDRLQNEFPDLFRRNRGGKRRINGGDDRDGGSRKVKPMTTTERQAAAIRGA